MGSAPEEIVIFTHEFSPFAQRVVIALREKGIPFKSVIVDLSNKPHELLEANPIWGQVPTITHRGIPVADSLVILQYLEEAFPEKVALMPNDAFGKSKVRFWTDYILKSLDDIGANRLVRMQAKFESPEKLEYMNGILKFLMTLDDAMTDFSKDGPYFTGEKFGYVDVVLAPLSSYVLLLEKVAGTTFPGPNEVPRFHRWMEAISTHKSVSDTLPNNEVVMEYFMSRFPKRTDGGRTTAAAQ